LDHGQRYGPAVFATDEAAGAVDRIDDETAPVLQPVVADGAFLAQPPIVRSRRGQRRLQEAIEDDVGLADRRTELLGPRLQLAPEIAGCDDAGGHCAAAQQLEILRVAGGGGLWHRLSGSGAPF